MITLLKNVNIFSPQPLGIKDVLVAGGKIAAIIDGHDKAKNLPPQSWDVEVVDFGGASLLPGFIDSHTHITGGGGEAGFSTQVPSVALSQFTDVGVTTVVGLLGTDDTTRSTGNLLARVYGLREEGLSAYCWTGGYHLPLTTLTGSAKSDIVYLEPVIGIGEFAISDHRSSQPTYQDVIGLVAEAHVAGLMTGKAGVMHFHLGDGERGLEFIDRAIAETEIPARVFHPAHVNRNRDLFAEACKLLSRGGYIDITAFPEGSVEPGLDALEAIQIAVERNLPLERITMSTDSGGCLPSFDRQGTLLRMDFASSRPMLATLQGALGAGLPLETVLPLFTSNVAELLRLQSKGKISMGHDADLLVLNEKYEITDVMAKGKWHKRDGKSVIYGTFE